MVQEAQNTYLLLSFLQLEKAKFYQAEDFFIQGIFNFPFHIELDFLKPSRRFMMNTMKPLFFSPIIT